jgi:hypothetical protein
MVPRPPAGSRRLALALLLVVGLSAGAGAQPSWELRGLQGGSLSSADVASGTTVMVVFAGWSPKCGDVVERTNALVQQMGGRARVVMVDFQEEPADVAAFLEGKGALARVYLDRDGAFSKQHRVMTLPGMVVYRDGAVVHQGKLENPDAVLSGGRR